MRRRKIWLLKLVLPFRYGRWLTGLLLLSLLLPFFYLGQAPQQEEAVPALFFSMILAYIIPVFSFITAKAQELLLELRGTLDMSDEDFAIAQERLVSASPVTVTLSLFLAALAGLIHWGFMRGSVSAAIADFTSSFNGFTTLVGTVVVWMIMTTVVTMLITQNRLFGQLGGRYARVSLLVPHKLLPFGRVSIISSLAILGALSLFPLISFESGLNLVESLPGAIAITAPLIALFVIPVWPVHRRLLVLKQEAITALNERIEGHEQTVQGPGPDISQLQQLVPLLNYKRELSQVSTWPFDLGNMTTLALYLIIPPLTWAGAALIENLVDSLI